MSCWRAVRSASVATTDAECGGQVGEEALLDEPSQGGEVGRLLGQLGDLGLGRRGDGVAVEARLDHGHGELGVPLELPGLLEGAGGAAARVGALAPVDAEERQAVEQDRPGQLRLASEVELDDCRRGAGSEPQRPLLSREVRGERHHRRRLRDLTELLADDERPVDEPEGQVASPR